jgi:hypothetical protein
MTSASADLYALARDCADPAVSMALRVIAGKCAHTERERDRAVKALDALLHDARQDADLAERVRRLLPAWLVRS